MGLGVLDVPNEQVPGIAFKCPLWQLFQLTGDVGTSYVLDDESRPPQNDEFDSRLKYDKSGPVPIILVPQPSDDPNDPLVSSLINMIESGLLTGSRTGPYSSAILSSPSSVWSRSLHRL